MSKKGSKDIISRDIELAELLFELADNHPELEVASQNLSSTTFRYIPRSYVKIDESTEYYLNDLNESMLNELKVSRQLYLSNAIIKGDYFLKTSIVNFRLSENTIREIVELIVDTGRRTHLRWQLEQLAEAKDNKVELY